MFGIDDKPIPGVDVPSLSNNIVSLGGSIALNPLACVAANKQKRKASSLDEPSNNTILLADNIQDSTMVLAQALTASLKFIPAPVPPVPAPIPALAPTAAHQPAIQNELLENQAFWEKIASIDARLTEVQTNIETQMGDVTSMLGRILATVRADKQRF